METEWMGRYRDLVAQVMRQTNIAIKDSRTLHDIGNGVHLNNMEWQVLEYIVENRHEDEKMIDIANSLGIHQSTFSKTVKKLVQARLVERYQFMGNRKNIILKPSPEAIDMYIENVQREVAQRFTGFFRELEPLGDQELELVTQAFAALNDDVERCMALSDEPQEPETLVKLPGP